MSFKIKEIKEIGKEELKKYGEQKNITRNREVFGGYDRIVFATDQDLD